MRPTQTDFVGPDRFEFDASPELFGELVLDALKGASRNLVAVEFYWRARPELLFQSGLQGMISEFDLPALEILDDQLDDAKALQPPDVASAPVQSLPAPVGFALKRSLMDVSMLKESGSLPPLLPATCKVSESLCLKTYPGKNGVKTFTLFNWLTSNLKRSPM